MIVINQQQFIIMELVMVIMKVKYNNKDEVIITMGKQ